MAVTPQPASERQADGPLPSYLDPATVAGSIERLEDSDWLPYLFRGHYLMGPRPVRVTRYWRSTKVAPSVFVSHDPTVEITSTETDAFSATLIGDVFDGRRPEDSNKDVLESWIRRCTSVDQVIRASDQLAGRWVLYLRSSARQVMIHDACGSLPIYYPRAKTSECWISSSPKLVAQQIDAALDQSLVDEIIKPYCLGSLEGVGLPVDRSPYDGIRCVLPNEALDLRDRMVQLYWPQQRLERRPLESVIEEGAERLAGIVHAMGHRRPLLIGTTAGTDSRIMLAAAQSRDVVFRSFTWSMDGHADYQHMDTRTAQRMTHLLQKDHYLIFCPTKFDQEPGAIFDACAVMPGASVQRAAAKHMRLPFADHFVLIGWGNGICRCVWRWPDWESATLSDIVACSGFRQSDAARALYEPWFDRAQRIRQDANIHVLDQLYWQLRVGRWVAENFTTLNLAQTVLTPFSSRAWLGLMLEAADGSRERSTKLYRDMILRLEPRFESIPYNPVPLGSRLKSFPLFLRQSAERAAAHLGLQGYLAKRRPRLR